MSDQSEPLQPDEIEQAIRAAFAKAMGTTAIDEHEQIVHHLISVALHAELARARAAVRVPPGIDELMDRLREQYPEAEHIDYGERARTEKALRDSPWALPLERPGKGSSSVSFLRSAEEVAAVKKQLGRE